MDKNKKYNCVFYILLILTFAYIIFIICKQENENKATTIVTIVLVAEYQDCIKKYVNSKTVPDYNYAEYLKINRIESIEGIKFDYGIILPLSLWEEKNYKEIVKTAAYFVNDYENINNKYNMDLNIGTITIEPNNTFRVGIGVSYIKTKKFYLNNADSYPDTIYKKLSFRFSEDIY